MSTLVHRQLGSTALTKTLDRELTSLREIFLKAQGRTVTVHITVFHVLSRCLFIVVRPHSIVFGQDFLLEFTFVWTLLRTTCVWGHSERNYTSQ